MCVSWDVPGAEVHVYVCRMGTVLFFRDLYASDRSVQERLDMQTARNSPQHIPAMRN